MELGEGVKGGGWIILQTFDNGGVVSDGSA